ncbi:MAG TPA: hypothetical protein VHO01_11905 [Jatrophihabitans sp.]|nr:hypothetical protein [Jatrophihabitans sp.]
MLRLPHDWAWDSWVVQDGELFHLFFLKAPRALGDPARRHTRARVGHATSTDLRSWREEPDALGPDPDGWDDLAIWTGSVVRTDSGGWAMFYTAICTRGYGVRDQRIGLATSADLYTWQRVIDRPVVLPDARWYQTLPEVPAGPEAPSETWRDPFVFPDPDGHGWRMLITARQRDAPRFDDGVLAEARSQDLIHWQVGPPVCRAGAGFGQLEVAQARMIGGRPTLVFTCHPDEQSAARRARWGAHSTWSVTGESLTGPWDVARAQPFTAEPTLFAAPLVQQPDGQWVLIGFCNREPEGVDAFEIIDPIPVRLAGGRLEAIGRQGSASITAE